MNGLVQLNFKPQFINLGLLVLRIVLGATLIIKHAWVNLERFMSPTPHFPDPLNIGIVPTMAFAFLADGICAGLVMLGLATRFAALIMMINLTVAWGMVHGFNLFVPTGEILALYLGSVIALALMGPGRFSLDARLARQHIIRNRP